MSNNWISRFQPCQKKTLLPASQSPQHNLHRSRSLERQPLCIYPTISSPHKISKPLRREIPTPMHSDPSLRKSTRKCREQGLRDINIIHGTCDARINHSGLDRQAGSRVGNADLRPTLGIGIWVATIGHLREHFGVSFLMMTGKSSRNTTILERCWEPSVVSELSLGVSKMWFEMKMISS